MDTLNEAQYTSLIISLSVLLGMKNVTDKICKKNRNTFCVQGSFFNLAIYEIRRQNVLERGRIQMTLWCTRITSWIPKARDTHSQYVILIAFLL